MNIISTINNCRKVKKKKYSAAASLKEKKNPSI